MKQKVNTKAFLTTILVLATFATSWSYAYYMGPNSRSQSGNSGSAYKMDVAHSEVVKEAMELLAGQRSEVSADLNQALQAELLKMFLERNSKIQKNEQ